MSRRLWLCALVVVAFVGAVAGVGALLEETHVVRMTALLSAPPEEVFATIRDFERAPAWREDLERVEMLSAPGEPVRFREIGENGAITFVVDESSPPHRLVTRIADPDLAFGGTWTYEVAAEGDGSRLTITEDGAVYNPIFRFLARFAFGYDATLRAYLADLGAKAGAKEEPTLLSPLAPRGGPGG